MIFFTADEHYGHTNIIKYCDRPFKTVEEMNAELIRRHNEVVSDGDDVIHCGDFMWGKPQDGKPINPGWYTPQLNGNHIFIRGSHDKWMTPSHGEFRYLFEQMVEDKYVVACHYAMRVWPRKHYGAWHVYGHSHGSLPSFGKSYDVGVDNNDFYPVSFDQLKEIMEKLPFT